MLASIVLIGLINSAVGCECLKKDCTSCKWKSLFRRTNRYFGANEDNNIQAWADAFVADYVTNDLKFTGKYARFDEKSKEVIRNYIGQRGEPKKVLIRRNAKGHNVIYVFWQWRSVPKYPGVKFPHYRKEYWVSYDYIKTKGVKGKPLRIGACEPRKLPALKDENGKQMWYNIHGPQMVPTKELTMPGKLSENSWAAIHGYTFVECGKLLGYKQQHPGKLWHYLQSKPKFSTVRANCHMFVNRMVRILDDAEKKNRTIKNLGKMDSVMHWLGGC